MAHKLFNQIIKTKNKSVYKWLSVQSVRFGFAIYVWDRELFIGIAINPVQEEQIIKKRFIKPEKATVRVLNFE